MGHIHRVRRTPSTAETDTRPRPIINARMSRRAQIVAMLVLGVKERVSGCAFDASLTYFPFVRLQAEAWKQKTNHFFPFFPW